MTRERKELLKQMDELSRQQLADYELGCGYCSDAIEEAFEPHWNALHDAWAATYGRTQEEHMDYIFKKQNAAYEAGKLPWSPCYGMSIM